MPIKIPKKVRIAAVSCYQWTCPIMVCGKINLLAQVFRPPEKVTCAQCDQSFVVEK